MTLLIFNGEISLNYMFVLILILILFLFVFIHILKNFIYLIPYFFFISVTYRDKISKNIGILIPEVDGNIFTIKK